METWRGKCYQPLVVLYECSKDLLSLDFQYEPSNNNGDFLNRWGSKTSFKLILNLKCVNGNSIKHALFAFL